MSNQRHRFIFLTDIHVHELSYTIRPSSYVINDIKGNLLNRILPVVPINF